MLFSKNAGSRPKGAFLAGGRSPPASENFIKNSFQNKFELISEYPASREMSIVPPRRFAARRQKIFALGRIN